jgi:hypothetical protein
VSVWTRQTHPAVSMCVWTGQAHSAVPMDVGTGQAHTAVLLIREVMTRCILITVGVVEF